MIVVAHTLIDGEDPVVGQTFLFGNVGDHIFPEAVHAHIQPKTEDLLYFLPDQGIVHIQVRLLDGEKVETVFFTHLILPNFFDKCFYSNTQGVDF